MSDLNINNPKDLGSIQQSKWVSATPKKGRQPIKNNINLGSHRINKNPPSSTRLTTEKRIEYYTKQIKRFNPAQLQTEIRESECKIRALNPRTDPLAKHSKTIEGFKLSALKQQQNSQVQISKMPIADDIRPVNSPHIPDPGNHQWHKFIQQGINDPNIKYVKIIQNKNQFNLSLTRQDGGVQNIIVKNTSDYKNLLSQVKLGKNIDDMNRISSNVKNMKQAKKALRIYNPGSYLVVSNPKKQNEFKVIIKTKSGPKSYKMNISDQGFTVQGKKENLSNTNFDQLVKDLHQRYHS